ncbi:hypothetical protein Bbelb_187370 [Branchiostoma belcheri]|nr:hypothetical protein Bbelb_187370 [Branchiostoma belcheri]
MFRMWRRVAKFGNKFLTGSALTLKYTCPRSHCGDWHSQPHVGDGTSFEGNLLPAAIVMAGDLTHDIVSRLMEPYIQSGRTLYCDNYYTSPQLFLDLSDVKTNTSETMRNRKGIPNAFKDATVSTQQQKFCMTNGTLLAMKYKDRRDLKMFTNASAKLVDTGSSEERTAAASDPGKLVELAGFNPKQQTSLIRLGHFLVITANEKMAAHTKYMYTMEESVTESFQVLIRRPGFLEKCEQWRERDILDNSMSDVYGGKAESLIPQRLCASDSSYTKKRKYTRNRASTAGGRVVSRHFWFEDTIVKWLSRPGGKVSNLGPLSDATPFADLVYLELGHTDLCDEYWEPDLVAMRIVSVASLIRNRASAQHIVLGEPLIHQEFPTTEA